MDRGGPIGCGDPLGSGGPAGCGDPMGCGRPRSSGYPIGSDVPQAAAILRAAIPPAAAIARRPSGSVASLLIWVSAASNLWKVKGVARTQCGTESEGGGGGRRSIRGRHRPRNGFGREPVPRALFGSPERGVLVSGRATLRCSPKSELCEADSGQVFQRSLPEPRAAFPTISVDLMRTLLSSWPPAPSPTRRPSGGSAAS